MKIAILDMQPIDPPTGGGRLRLLGLYHALGAGLNALYVGTYDWSGPKFRRQFLSASLEEMLVPLSAQHFAASGERLRAAGGRAVIDTTFHEFAHLSPAYVAAAREAAASADIVVFSHPWIHPVVHDVLDPLRQLIVYDAHNMEGLLRMQLLDDGGAGTDVVRGAVAVEHALCHAAHLILACSHEDRRAFNRLYGVPCARFRVVANGAFTESLFPATLQEKAAARRNLGLGSEPAAFFVGSNYGPNVEAARFITGSLAPELRHITFIVSGSVGESLASDLAAPNLRVTGLLSDAQKHDWLRAADFAVNPMFDGSGSNIKMLEFMAAGLPIVTTPMGARGIKASEEDFLVTERRDFAGAIERLLADSMLCTRLGRAARELATLSHSWERLSPDTGALLVRHAKRSSRASPFFSVIVPSYERPDSLVRLVESLAQQSWHDFEVIVVDQSAQACAGSERDFGVDLTWTHSDIRGAARARNRGADLARGQILAFIDDDCDPGRNWLAAAHAEFTTRDIVGLEGLIVSDHDGDPQWRRVTNDGFEGFAFMTANLFLQAETFHALDGFDVAFDNPHFREDTDLGWRAQELGAIPFSRHAWVRHPAQPRSTDRESLAARSRFFEQDALLLRKHPKRYPQLMRRESQWTHNPSFWTHFLAGARRHKVVLPDEILKLMPDDVRARLGHQTHLGRASHGFGKSDHPRMTERS